MVKPENTEEDSEQKRKLHQKELHAKLQKLGLEKYADENTDKSTKDVAVFKRFESYKRESQLPINTKDLRIQVDAKNQTIILPIKNAVTHPFTFRPTRMVVKTKRVITST